LSAVGRQGWFIGLAHPARAAKTVTPMLKALTSEYKSYQIDQEIRNRPNAPLYSKSKLELPTLTGKLTAMEEAFMSRLGGEIPGIKQSQRAYVTYLNKLRADSFDAMTRALARSGEPTDAELKAIANYINVATGRGPLNKAAPAAEILATVFWSPRLLVSRFQLLAGQPLYHGSARTRKLIAQEYGRFLIGMGVIYALGEMIGAEIEIDPRSSDFGKLKFGDTRVDPMAGLSQTTVFLARIAAGEKKVTTGRIRPIRGERVRRGEGTVNVIANFLRAKLSPLLGTTVDIAAGKTVVGEPVTPADVVARNVVPLAFKDVYDVMIEHGIAQGTALTLLSIFGVGIQNYERRTRATKSKLEQLKARIKIYLKKSKGEKSSESPTGTPILPPPAPKPTEEIGRKPITTTEAGAGAFPSIETFHARFDVLKKAGLKENQIRGYLETDLRTGSKAHWNEMTDVEKSGAIDVLAEVALV